MPTIYRKTAKGAAEIETRAHRLPPRLRGVLIVVDGKQPDSQIAAMLPLALDSLAQLAAQGFIEAVAVTAEPAVAGAASASSAAPAAGPPSTAGAPPDAGMTLEARRGAIVRAFNDLAGPQGEAVAMRLERAKSFDELRTLLPQAARMVDSLRGRELAEQFLQRIGDL